MIMAVAYSVDSSERTRILKSTFPRFLCLPVNCLCFQFLFLLLSFLNLPTFFSVILAALRGIYRVKEKEKRRRQRRRSRRRRRREGEGRGGGEFKKQKKKKRESRRKDVIAKK